MAEGVHAGLALLALAAATATGTPRRRHECVAIGDRLKAIPEVLECYRVTGSDSHVLRVAVRSVELLEGLITRVMPQSGDTITALVLTTPVSYRSVTRDMTAAPVKQPARPRTRRSGSRRPRGG